MRGSSPILRAKKGEGMANRHRHAAVTTKLAGLVDATRSDGIARWCGLAVIAFLWLAAALREPAFLPLVLAAAAALRFRLAHKPEEPTDELF
jgi:hypothetical protein